MTIQDSIKEAMERYGFKNYEDYDKKYLFFLLYDEKTVMSEQEIKKLTI